MEGKDPIEISSESDLPSSDDDELQEVSPQPESLNSSKRRLPSWAQGNEGFHMQHPGPSSSRGTRSHVVHRVQAESTPSTSYSTGNQTLNSRVGIGNGSSFQHRKNDEKSYWNNSSHARDARYEQHLNKRAFPSSMQPSETSTKQRNSWDNLSSNRGLFSKGNDGDGSMYDANHPCILPLTLVRGKPGSSGDHTTSGDPYQTMGFGEESVLGDERLIYQAALQDLSQPRAELDIPQGLLSVPLLRHQKIALAWMVEKESRTMHCLGGILADDQGLGKTISTIALILKQWPAQIKSQSEKDDNQFAEALNLDDDDDDNTGDKYEDSNVGKCKSVEVSNSEPELYNLDEDDDNGSGSVETVKKMEKVDGLKSNSGSSSSQKVPGKRPSADVYAR